MKQKILVALAALSLMLMLSACKMGNDETSSLNEQNNSSNISSVVSGNIPENNSDGNYDNSNDSSKTLGEDISSFISSGNNAISSMMD